MAQTDQSSVPLASILGAEQSVSQLTEAQLVEAILGAYDSFNAVAYRIPPYNPDQFLASRGYQVLDDMLALTQVRAPLNIIRSAVLYKGVEVHPAVTDQYSPEFDAAKEIADAFEYAISNIEDEAGNCQDFRHVLFELAYAVHTGFRVTEINWRCLDEGVYTGKYGFANFAAKPCKQIGFDVDYSTLAVRSLVSYTPMTGYQTSIPTAKVIHYVFDPRDSLPYGNGVGRTAYKHSWSIDFLYKCWNIALEQFGGPFILAKASPVGGMMAMAAAAIAKIRQGAPGVLPTGVEAELHEIAGGGLAAFENAVNHHGEQCAMAYLNSVLTSGTASKGTNTNALGKVHQDTSEYGLGYIRTDIENVVYYQLARRFVKYNYGAEFRHLTPRLSLGDWDSTDMAALSKAFSTLTAARIMHPDEPVIREKLKVGQMDPDIRTKMDDENVRNQNVQANADDPASADPNDPEAGDPGN